MSREQAVRHSLAWLQLLAAGRRRAEARQALTELQVMSAIAASFHKGGAPVEKLAAVLRERAEG